MRIERIQASPHKKGRVLVFLEDGACLKITEQELLDFGLRPGDDLDARRLGQLKEAAGVSNVKAAAAETAVSPESAPANTTPTAMPSGRLCSVTASTSRVVRRQEEWSPSGCLASTWRWGSSTQIGRAHV